MSTAAATAPTDAPAPKGKKKLIIIVAAALLVVLLGGVGAMLLLKKKPVDEEGDETPAEQVDKKGDAAVKRDPKTPPAYVPREMFVVNLADRDAERYAQIGITLEMLDAKVAEQIKTFQPAIRNNILMVLANKTSADLLSREGKTQLAGEIQRAASRALGVDVPEPGAKPDKAKVKKAADDEEEDEDAPKKKKKKKAAPPPVLPILAVHFSNFIVQ